MVRDALSLKLQALIIDIVGNGVSDTNILGAPEVNLS
jgi:hypothetical protein